MIECPPQGVKGRLSESELIILRILKAEADEQAKLFRVIEVGNTYTEYQCRNCQQRFVRDMEDAVRTHCPSCGADEGTWRPK